MPSAFLNVNGAAGFVRGPGVHPCCACGAMAELLCDAPVGDGKTCDRYLCEEHATTIGEDVHLCPYHAARAPQDLARVDRFLELRGLPPKEGE